MWRRILSGSSRIVLGVALLGGLLGCYPQTPGPNLTAVQGWSAQYRNAWYNGDQGSRLMPLPWMMALEQPIATPPAGGATPGPFMDDAYLAQFRILPPEPGAVVHLPVGFAVDRGDDSSFVETNLRWYAGQNTGGDWIGLNCAACHTAQMSYQGHAIRVDGAPSLFDFQSFVDALDQALAQTRDSAAPRADSARWDRFAKKILGTNDNPDNRTRLLASLNRLLDWETRTAALNKTDLRYGPGRVDAVGHIFNRILLFGGAPQPVPNAPDAPVSYPHLWNITKESHLQWDGIAQNAKISLNPFYPGRTLDYGALGRNAGEVLGVFGDLVIKPPATALDISGFKSSVDLVNLNRMELQLADLKSPVWPADVFGKPGDIGLADASGHTLSPEQVLAAGATLFQTNCSQCHTPHTNPSQYETMVPFSQMGEENRTDEWMACNTWDDKGFSGKLTGVKADYVTGTPLTANEPVATLLATSVKGALIGKKGQLIETSVQTFLGITPPPTVAVPHAHGLVSAKDLRLARCLATSDPLMAYKARPLEGIWATAPYLHNGAVPTLYDLLSPPEKRPVTFMVGTRTFDPKNVGYDTGASTDGNTFMFDTRIAGNSNKGHVYGATRITDAERRELLEYLKTL